MRLRRQAVGILGAALVGAVPAALTATPAQADSTPSEVQGAYYTAPDGNNVWRYGQSIRFEADVMVPCDAEDTTPFDCRPIDEVGDSVTLERRRAGATTWAPLATKDVAGATVAFAVASTGSAAYRIVYSGGTSVEYSPSASLFPTLKGSRNPRGTAVITRQGAFYRGNVDPGWGRRSVTIQRKTCAADSCPWRAYKTVTTTRTGAYSAKIAVPRTGRLYWRSTVAPTSPQFVRAYGNPYYTARARTAARMAGAGR